VTVFGISRPKSAPRPTGPPLRVRVNRAAAARAYAERVFTEGDLAAVYSVGAGVHIYQSFTSSRERLLNGIQAATAANAAVPGDVAEEIRTEIGLLIIARSPVAATPVKARFDFVREGISAFQFEQSLPPPDTNGEARQLVFVDLARLKPGKYELRVTVDGGPELSSAKTAFVVVK
jgi:hypothetical protein